MMIFQLIRSVFELTLIGLALQALLLHASNKSVQKTRTSEATSANSMNETPASSLQKLARAKDGYPANGMQFSKQLFVADSAVALST
jgi:hypothetical protein